MANKKKISYVQQYNLDTYRRVALIVRKDDKEINDKLDSVPNKNNYIINLIRDDIAKEKGEDPNQSIRDYIKKLIAEEKDN